MGGGDEGDAPPGSIPLTQASLQQLNMVKQQLEQELKGLMKNLEALREAESRFKASSETLVSLVPENEGKAMLVPLTTSLYIDGHMKDTSKVTVDVGTGYFIEMSVERAKKFCGRRTQMLTDNATKVEKMLKEKRKNYEMVAQTMQLKYAKMQEAMEAQKSGS
uniref:Prefoldin subunit 5 n=1 Tax=Zooxanthella nutricula TaxID=1333877 RepID=A0A6U8Y5Q3_9DINO